MCEEVCRSQKTALDFLELEFQVGVSHQIWVLGTELVSCEEQERLLADEHLQLLTHTFCCVVSVSREDSHFVERSEVYSSNPVRVTV